MHTETGPHTWHENLLANAHNLCPLARAESAHGHNPNNASNGTGDVDHTGYTNVQKHITGLTDFPLGIEVFRTGPQTPARPGTVGGWRARCTLMHDANEHVQIGGPVRQR
ncbi:hypothetical protein [Dactylosporangium matsuzakiense]|uniref:Uncharacterized protein n=1 Tax=Dactylosporangium matsuzakiense TaxID=53360 RepID=A0A9W6KUD3_9ACTN|nr:hypothetical protein [Dactylosporangium matsuzakiense]UWZ46978.1 hypothetical protein Dmats_11565 [Dactylosporangium matsuzakiense]GLL06874.1 hypothetical protein GCM10017581_086240 [Dactylosporangium matsuzakiense]